MSNPRHARIYRIANRHDSLGEAESPFNKMSYNSFQFYLDTLSRLSETSKEHIKQDLERALKTYVSDYSERNWDRIADEVFDEILSESVAQVNSQWRKAREQYKNEMKDIFHKTFKRWKSRHQKKLEQSR